MNMRVILLALALFFMTGSWAHAALIGKPLIGNGSGLVGWWTFDGTRMTPNVVDSSGQGNNGTISGQTATTTTTGKLGQALTFDGTNDLVNAGSATSMDDIQSQGGGGMTVTGWMRPRVSTSGVLVAKGSGASFTGAWQVQLLTGNRIRFVKEGGTDMQARSSTNSVISQEWQHFAVTWNGGTTASQVTLYINGVAKSHDIDTDGATFTSEASLNMTIGNFADGSDPFNGDLDDVRIYNRVFSATEIRALYSAGGVKFGATETPGSSLLTGLAGWWTFDGADVTSSGILDKSGNGHTMIIVNGAATTSMLAAGRLGQGIHLDGVNDRLSTPSFSEAQGTALTVSHWINVKPTNFSIFSGKFPSGVSGWDFQTEGTNTQLLMVFYPSASKGNTPAILTAGWHHIVAVYDGTGTANSDKLKIYYDGVLQTLTFTGTIPASITTNTTPVTLGGWVTGTAPFAGVMDETRMWNRALTPVEVTELYNQGSGQKTAGTPVQANKDSLVGWWTFDGPRMTPNVRDSSGQGSNGTLNGQPATTTTAGRVGQALTFDGTNDYVDTGASSLYDFTDEQMTVAAWVKPADLTSVMAIAGRRNMSSGWGFFVNGASAGAPLRFSIFGVIDQDSSSSGLVRGQWNHVAVTYNKSTISFYVNGSLVSSHANTSDIVSAGSRSLYLGAFNNTGTFANPMNGALDEVRVYSRPFSAAEIKQLYNAGR